MGSCRLAGISITGGICRKLLLFLTQTLPGRGGGGLWFGSGRPFGVLSRVTAKATSRCRHQPVTSQTRVSHVVLPPSAPQSCSPGGDSHPELHSLLLLLCWLEWKVASSPLLLLLLLLLQPIQSKVKWCVLSETSSCTRLLHWVVIDLLPVNLNKFCRSPLTPYVSLCGAVSENGEQQRGFSDNIIISVSF